MNIQGYPNNSSSIQSLLVQPAPSQYTAVRLSRDPGANVALVEHLRQTGIDCDTRRDGIAVYRRNVVEFVQPGQVLVYDENRLEVLPDQDFERRYQPLAA